FKLFAEVAKQPRENIFISPLSVALVLSMVYNGARGETQRAMAEALDLSGANLDEINQSSAALLQSLGQIDPAIHLAIANSAWARQGTSFAPDFLERAQQFYHAMVTELDFSAPDA